MTNGYSHYDEIESLLAAVIALAGPGNPLHSAAEGARDRFRGLDHSSKCSAADGLMECLEVALGVWSRRLGG